MSKNKTQKNIPERWQEKKFADVFKIGSGKDYKHLGHGDVPVFGTGGYMLSVNKSLHSGKTVFIGRKGTIDKPFFYNGDFWTVDTLFYTYDFKDTTAEFVNLIFQKIQWKKYNEASGVPSLSKATIEKIKFIFPPLPEQNRIVAVLETWDEYLEKLSRKIKIKKNIKKGIASQIMNCELSIVNGKKVYAPKLRLSGFSEEWESVKLGEVCQRIRTGKLDANAMVKNGKYRFYTCAKDFYKIDEHAFNTEALLVSGNGANVGYIHYYKGKFNAYQRTYILDKFKSNIFFVKYILDKFLKQRIFAEKCDGNTPYIKMDTLTDMKIKIPKTLKEQTAIAKILTTTDKEIEALEKKKKIIEEQKKFLLNNLMTGKIKVNCEL